MSRFAAVSLALVLPALAAGGAAADGGPVAIGLPSGATVTWQETRHDNSGGLGLTYRFRFVMPDLAARVPALEAGDAAGAADRAPIDIDTESGEITGGETDAAPPATAPGKDTDDGDEEAERDADAMVGQALDPALDPAAPDALAQDPIHDDILWLCENWVLPRIASPAPRPSQIIISLASRETAFGAYDPGVIQLFEAFRLPPDRDACEWEPW